MNRTQIIFELAKYEHPSNYKHVIAWPTEKLQKLLDTYKAIERGDVVVYPYIMVSPVGEPLKNKLQFHDIK